LGNFQCHYYQTGSGRSPIEEFIDSLSFNTQRKFFAKIGWLEETGHKLPFPHTKKIAEDLYELRFEGEDGAVRILYFFYLGNKIILLHGFKKKTEKTPKKDLELADDRRKDFLSRVKGT